MASIRWRAPRTVAVGALAVLAGCGGEEPREAPSATVAADEPTAAVGTDYAVDPESGGAEDATERVESDRDNQGSLPHNLTVFEGESQVGTTETIEGAASDSITLELEPGTYRMVCTVGDHEELGMVGDLEIRSKRR